MPMIENICRIGGVVGSAVATGSAAILGDVSKGFDPNSLTALFTTSGVGAAIAWVCIRHILMESKRQSEVIKAKDKKIEELNKLIFVETKGKDNNRRG